jgi:D-alanyl-lipoteichoic acid acyltransferase DltB (MBOAT superfamily)
VLFNSKEFLFVFLPLTLLFTAVAVGFWGRTGGVVALALASLFFYAWWEVRALAVIGISIAFNYSLARSIASNELLKYRRLLLFVGVTGNIVALGYFKYANFFISNIGAIIGVSFDRLNVVLPLAISFFTFQQIAFLVDIYHGKMSQVPLLKYIISVVFFPHLIAGPLLHYRDIIAQFDRRFAVSWATILAGLPVFAVGLAKKVGIADPIAQFVSPLFKAAQTAPPEFFDAWAAALGYTAQLYFDFSGYSDMAIGLGLMFGITLPLNFYSPYKATSIIEFWRRWHMTLSSFLRDYLYFPLGGSRVGGPLRRYANLVIVMLVGGLWHGAAWTFVFWGALHGTFLILNHLWRNLVGNRIGRLNPATQPIYSALTFILVVIAWVFFRAQTFGTALNVLSGMFKPSVVSLPGELAYLLNKASIAGIAWGKGMSFADFSAFWVYTVLAYTIIWLAPNTSQLFNLEGRSPIKPERLEGLNLVAHVTAIAALFWVAGFGIFSAAPSEFLYFQF